MPVEATATLQVLIGTPAQIEAQIGTLDARIARCAKENDVAQRLMTIPGTGPLIATAIAVLAPPPETFRRARDFAAWLGLVPRQRGKQRLGATTKMGERSLRRLLIIGANSVIIKRHIHREAQPGTWLGDLLSRKPAMLVRVALANSERCRATGSSKPRTARIVWAFAIVLEPMAPNGSLARGGVYRSSVAAG